MSDPPHSAVWYTSMLVLGVTLFASAYGIGSSMIEAKRKRNAEEEHVRGYVRNALLKR